MQEHTFLFTDLVGYTSLADAEGDDRAADVALLLHRRVRGLLGEFGAAEVKSLGDGLMLHCSDAAASLRLALRIVEELEAEPGFPAVRVGVHTGSAVTRDGDWYGRGVNVAARLCSVAPGGEVLASDATRRAARRLWKIDFGERRMHWLRNVTEPVATYSVRPRACPGGRLRSAARVAAARRGGPPAGVEASA